MARDTNPLSVSWHKRYLATVTPSILHDYLLYEIETKVRVEIRHEPMPKGEAATEEDEALRDCYTR